MRGGHSGGRGRGLVTVGHQPVPHRFPITNTIKAFCQGFPSFSRIVVQAYLMGQLFRA